MTNEVLEVAGVRKELMGRIRSGYFEFLGHLLRGNGLESKLSWEGQGEDAQEGDKGWNIQSGWRRRYG